MVREEKYEMFHLCCHLANYNILKVFSGFLPHIRGGINMEQKRPMI